MASVNDKPMLLVVIEHEVERKQWRAHCLELDLAVSAQNEEQVMCRIESMINAHLQYAIKNKSNPWHIASDEIIRKWMENAPGRRSWILVYSGSKSKPKILRKFRRNMRPLQPA